MGRTVLPPQRLADIQKTNIGRIIIFCEGQTEKHYFDYFASIINKSKYSQIEVVLQTAGGNARRVLNYAREFMLDDDNNRKYSTYGKYLVFDCDAPRDIQSVVSDAVADQYNLLITNFLFETWLLMHFEDIAQKIGRKKTYDRLSSHLHNEYEKGDEGTIREIISNGDIAKAIDNAREWERHYAAEGKNIYLCVKDMNPYTSVHTLIEQFMVEISS